MFPKLALLCQVFTSTILTTLIITISLHPGLLPNLVLLHKMVLLLWMVLLKMIHSIWDWMRLQVRCLGRIRVLETPRVHPITLLETGFLSPLPKRVGPRPTISGPAPQRQSNQRAEDDTFALLSAMLKSTADRWPALFRVGPSFLERHTIALFNRQEFDPHHPLFGHEIAHPQKTDGGMCVVLHPADVKVVLESGWGERRPLARADPPQSILDWLWPKFFTRLEGRPPVPEELVRIYAPRNEEELFWVDFIVMAAVSYCAGEVLRALRREAGGESVEGGKEKGVPRVEGRRWAADLLGCVPFAVLFAPFVWFLTEPV